MGFEPSEQAGQQKLGATAIWIGLVLICIALARIFILPALTDENPAAPIETPITEVSASLEAPVENIDNSQPQEALPEYSPEISNSGDVDDFKAEEPMLSKSESVTTSVESVQPAVLQTYYAEVQATDGTIQTLTISAPNEDKARTIIRDFRGNPKILSGPTLEITW